jgi:FkbM family methyltransferase
MIKEVVRKIADAFGYTILKNSQIGSPIEYPFINSLELILHSYLQQNFDLFFMQIGAHDGCSADPIHHLVQQYHWRGLLVEPQPKAFAKLKQTYEDESQLIFENALIGRENGFATLYTIRDEKSMIPFWLSQSASPYYEIVKSALYYWKHIRQLEALPDDYEKLIEAVSLPSITIRSALAKHNIAKVDLAILNSPESLSMS